jgi:hypothetical protein
MNIEKVRIGQTYKLNQDLLENFINSHGDLNHLIWRLRKDSIKIIRKDIDRVISSDGYYYPVSILISDRKQKLKRIL